MTTKFVPVLEYNSNNQLVPVTANNAPIQTLDVQTYSASTSFPTTTPSVPLPNSTVILNSVSCQSSLYYVIATNEYLVQITETGFSTYREFMTTKVYYKDDTLVTPRHVYYTPWSVTTSSTGRVYKWPTGYYRNTNIDRIEIDYISWWTKINNTWGYIWIGTQLHTA